VDGLQGESVTWIDWQLRRIAQSRHPVIVGPFRTEPGFECLYWHPFLTKWRIDHKVDSERLIALTRGGAGHWYQMGRIVELYDYLPIQDLRVAMLQDHKERESVKHVEPAAFEQPLMDMLAARLGLKKYHVLHPSFMYKQLAPWWGNDWSLNTLVKHLTFAVPAVPLLPIDIALPERFVCVRFYQRPTWPLTEETRDWVNGLIHNLAQHIPVVVIGSTVYADTHVDFPIEAHPNVTNLVDAFPIRDNLGMQSAVIAKAACFLGTYGGLMQLAVRLGIPSAGFYLDWHHTAYAHKILTEWLGVQARIPVFVGRPQEADFIRQIYPVQLELPKFRGGSSSGVNA
jgi:hypothetical protein